MEKYITIYWVSEPETLKGEDGPDKRWKLIAEYTDDKGQLGLHWLYTYNAKLAVTGMKGVQFYKDRKYNLCVRIPRKE